MGNFEQQRFSQLLHDLADNIKALIIVRDEAYKRLETCAENDIEVKKLRKNYAKEKKRICNAMVSRYIAHVDVWGGSDEEKRSFTTRVRNDMLNDFELSKMIEHINSLAEKTENVLELSESEFGISVQNGADESLNPSYFETPIEI